jgi:hypothetical protein
MSIIGNSIFHSKTNASITNSSSSLFFSSSGDSLDTFKEMIKKDYEDWRIKNNKAKFNCAFDDNFKIIDKQVFEENLDYCLDSGIKINGEPLERLKARQALKHLIKKYPHCFDLSLNFETIVKYSFRYEDYCSDDFNIDKFIKEYLKLDNLSQEEYEKINNRFNWSLKTVEKPKLRKNQKIYWGINGDLIDLHRYVHYYYFKNKGPFSDTSLYNKIFKYFEGKIAFASSSDNTVDYGYIQRLQNKFGCLYFHCG